MRHTPKDRCGAIRHTPKGRCGVNTSPYDSRQRAVVELIPRHTTHAKKQQRHAPRRSSATLQEQWLSLPLYFEVNHCHCASRRSRVNMVYKLSALQCRTVHYALYTMAKVSRQALCGVRTSRPCTLPYRQGLTDDTATTAADIVR